MKQSLSFDQAASYYDQTRPLFEPIAKLGVQAILDVAGPGARILDVGTGTGRISIPLLERGADLIGCDISARMLGRLQEKYPNARLARADASALPFPSGRFDAVLTVHVLHLIASWQEALREFRRLVGPRGVYLNVRTYAPVGRTIRDQMRRFWRDWVQVQGVQIFQPGIRDDQEFVNELESLGADLTSANVVNFTLPFTLREELERFTSRIYSDAWHIPEDVHAASMVELYNWTAREYGDLDQQREDEVQFVIDVVRFHGGG